MPDPKPPRACVFVKGLPGGAKVEIECIAAQDWSRRGFDVQRKRRLESSYLLSVEVFSSTLRLPFASHIHSEVKCLVNFDENEQFFSLWLNCFNMQRIYSSSLSNECQPIQRDSELWPLDWSNVTWQNLIDTSEYAGHSTLGGLQVRTYLCDFMN